MAFLVLVNTMDDEKSKSKKLAGNEDRETLHEYVGGWNSNPITSDTPDDAERRGGSGTQSGTDDSTRTGKKKTAGS